MMVRAISKRAVQTNPKHEANSVAIAETGRFIAISKMPQIAARPVASTRIQAKAGTDCSDSWCPKTNSSIVASRIVARDIPAMIWRARGSMVEILQPECDRRGLKVVR